MKKLLLVCGAGAKIKVEAPALTRETLARVEIGALWARMAAESEEPYDLVICSEGAVSHGRHAGDMMVEDFRSYEGCESIPVIAENCAADSCQNIQFALVALLEQGIDYRQVKMSVVCEPHQYKRIAVTTKAWGLKADCVPVDAPEGFGLVRWLMEQAFMVITLADPKGNDSCNLLIQHSRKSRRAMWDQELHFAEAATETSVSKGSITVVSDPKPNLDGSGVRRDTVVWRIITETDSGYFCERGWWIFRERSWFARDDCHIAEVCHLERIAL